MAANCLEHRFRWIRESWGLSFEGGGIKEAGRHAQDRRECVHRHLVRLDVDGDDARHGHRREALRGQSPAYQSH